LHLLRLHAGSDFFWTNFVIFFLNQKKGGQIFLNNSFFGVNSTDVSNFWEKLAKNFISQNWILFYFKI
jgi:hypothetical protein